MKKRKKRLRLLGLALSAAILLPALALFTVQADDWDGDGDYEVSGEETSEPDYIPAEYAKPLYVNRESIKVFARPNKKAEVMAKLKGATEVYLEGTSLNGNWYLVNFQNEYGGTWVGWVLAESMTDTFPQSLCSHKWEDWTVDHEATCTDTGYQYRYCKICGILDESSIPALGHKFGKWKVGKEATCTQKGYRVRTCKRCDYEEKEEYLADHTYGEWTVRKKPTCTEKGLRARTCKVCNQEQTQEMDKLPHEYEYKILTEATDHSAGTRVQICKNCGHKTEEESFDPEGTMRINDRGENVYEMQQLLVDQGYLNVGGADGVFGGGTEKAVMQFQKDQGITPDGVVWPQTRQRMNHDFGPWKTTKEMTRVEAGERTRTCKDCGYEQHETVEPGIVFEKGRRGEDIRALQQILSQCGFDTGAFDGIYGQKLDDAMAKFGDSIGMKVEAGRIRPADVDAVVYIWTHSIPEAEWIGEGNVDTPVDLALTVTPTGEADDDGVMTYSWSVTNLGTEKAMFNALLLTFGEDPDFKEGSLVMVLDGVELNPGAAGSAQGSFSAKSGWGTGNLNFAALGVSESDGAKWLSNSVSFENLSVPQKKLIAPISEAIDVSKLEDGIYAASFDRGDVSKGASGIYMNAVHIYTQDWYDLAEIGLMEVGDTILVEDEEVPVLSIEKNEWITVNEDQDARAFDLVTEEDTNGYFVRGLDDMGTYTEQGVTTLTVSPDAVFTDSSDLENDPVTVSGSDIVDAMQSSANEAFTQFNTTIRVEAGKVVEINRVFVP